MKEDITVMTNNPSLIHKRDFDSTHFGILCGQIFPKDLEDPNKVSQIQAEIREGRYQFLLLRVPISSSVPYASVIFDPSTVATLGFSYVDSHHQLDISLSGSLKIGSFETKGTSEYIVREEPLGSDNPSIGPLLPLAVDLSSRSRLSLDPYVDPAQVKRLYELWIYNSFAGSAADFVYTVALQSDSSKPLGFITYKKEDDLTVDLSLLTIADSARGINLGSFLVHESLKNLHSKGFIHCTVTASAQNQGAVRFYEKCGFRTSGMELIFHAHYKHES